MAGPLRGLSQAARDARRRAVLAHTHLRAGAARLTRLPRLPRLAELPGGGRSLAVLRRIDELARHTARWLRTLFRQRLPDTIRMLRQRVRYDPELDHTRTRQQRVAARGRRLEAGAAVGAVLLCLLIGTIAPAPGSGTQQAQASSGTAAPDDDPDDTAADADGTALQRSAPVRLRIPQLGADVEVFGAELDPDGGPPTPAEEDAHRAAWHAGGVSPGESGAALIVGHLDTYDGPAAFAGLGSLDPGTALEVEREDGTTARFTVDLVEQYPKDDFPNDQVYGTVDTPQLRLITCGGNWRADGGYDANVVAYARLDDGADAAADPPTELAEPGAAEPPPDPESAEDPDAPLWDEPLPDAGFDESEMYGPVEPGVGDGLDWGWEDTPGWDESWEFDEGWSAAEAWAYDGAGV